MADEAEETRKMVEKLDKRDKDIVKLKQLMSHHHRE